MFVLFHFLMKTQCHQGKKLFPNATCCIRKSPQHPLRPPDSPIPAPAILSIPGLCTHAQTDAPYRTAGIMPLIDTCNKQANGANGMAMSPSSCRPIHSGKVAFRLAGLMRDIAQTRKNAARRYAIQKRKDMKRKMVGVRGFEPPASTSRT